VNGQPGAVVVDADGRTVYVVGLDVADDAVQAVRSMLNPDKLRHLAGRR
jgi:RNA polymerase sigma-70 factor (ECF subfamily)